MGASANLFGSAGAPHMAKPAAAGGSLFGAPPPAIGSSMGGGAPNPFAAKSTPQAAAPA